MKNYYGVDFAEQKEKLLKSETAKVIINDVIERAEKALGKTYAALKLSEYRLFSETGDRAIFEKKYFEEMAKDNNLIKLVVKSYFLESYLGYQDMTNLGKSANSEVTVEENLISSIVTKYISDSKKDITINMSFSY